jgi:hypothetical protein
VAQPPTRADDVHDDGHNADRRTAVERRRTSAPIQRVHADNTNGSHHPKISDHGGVLWRNGAPGSLDAWHDCPDWDDDDPFTGDHNDGPADHDHDAARDHNHDDGHDHDHDDRWHVTGATMTSVRCKVATKPLPPADQAQRSIEWGASV